MTAFPEHVDVRCALGNQPPPLPKPDDAPAELPPATGRSWRVVSSDGSRSDWRTAQAARPPTSSGAAAQPAPSCKSGSADRSLDSGGVDLERLANLERLLARDSAKPDAKDKSAASRIAMPVASTELGEMLRTDATLALRSTGTPAAVTSPTPKTGPAALKAPPTPPVAHELPLSRVVEAWPTLPQPAKAAILAVVEAAAPKLRACQPKLDP